MHGRIFNIQKFSIHDGPGIRTIVFFKGCPLKCWWCANPEGINLKSDLAFKKNRCIGSDKCGICQTKCPQKAIETEDNFPKIKRSICSSCGDCAKFCPAKALSVFGEEKSVEEIIDVIIQDDIFYARSGGGVTLSGGEPLLQADFAQELLKKAHDNGISTAIETTCFVPWENIEKVFPHLDNVYIDLKSADVGLHIKYTGVNPCLIWENVERICRVYKNTPIIFRTPVIYGVNDSSQEIQKIVDKIMSFTNSFAQIKYELLPYHAFGINKYNYLDLPYLLAWQTNMPKERVEEIKESLNAPFEILVG